MLRNYFITIRPALNFLPWITLQLTLLSYLRILVQMFVKYKTNLKKLFIYKQSTLFYFYNKILIYKYQTSLKKLFIYKLFIYKHPSLFYFLTKGKILWIGCQTYLQILYGKVAYLELSSHQISESNNRLSVRNSISQESQRLSLINQRCRRILYV